MPPPLSAELPLIVLSVASPGMPRSSARPPPSTAELPLIVQPVSVAVVVFDAAAVNGRRVAADRAVGERHAYRSRRHAAAVAGRVAADRAVGERQVP